MDYLLRHNAGSTLFQKLSLLVIALAAATAATSVLADPPGHRGNSPRFSASHHDFRPDFRRHVTPVNRFHSRVDRRRAFGGSNFYDSRYRYRRHDHDGWSVSLNLGTGWYGGSTFGASSLYYGTGLSGRPYIPYRNRTTVIYTQPSVVYVNDSSRVTGHVSERVVRQPARPSRSLLRDIHGDCWERTYDSRGIETRSQLPASACRF